MREPAWGRPKIEHPYAWLWEPLEEDPGFVLRAMFGAKAAYLDGRLAACFMAKEEPWLGLLVCTFREHHAALAAEFPGLIPHEVLGKWLYLPESDEHFERTAQRIVQAILFRDPRIGVEPPPRKARRSKKRRKRLPPKGK